MLMALVLPSFTFAGNLYKCESGKGEIIFTNKPASSRNCKKIASYVDTPASRKSSLPGTPKVNYQSSSQPIEAVIEKKENKTESSTINAKSAGKTSSTPTIHRGAVYKISHANGITEYTNVPPKQPGAQLLFTYIATCYACNVSSTIDWSHTKLKLNVYNDEITKAAIDFGVEAALIRAVIHAESAFNPNAVSNKGAQGLMQLMPGTASDLNVSNPFDPEQNIRGGAQYLAMLLKNFNGDTKLATAAYNAGEANVRKYEGIPPFDETKVYVERVGVLHERYQKGE